MLSSPLPSSRLPGLARGLGNNGMVSCRLDRVSRQKLLGVSPPLGTPPPKPVILFNLFSAPALIFASRRALRCRACSAARAAAASSSDVNSSVIVCLSFSSSVCVGVLVCGLWLEVGVIYESLGDECPL